MLRADFSEISSLMLTLSSGPEGTSTITRQPHDPLVGVVEEPIVNQTLVHGLLRHMAVWGHLRRREVATPTLLVL